MISKVCGRDPLCCQLRYLWYPGAGATEDLRCDPWRDRVSSPHDEHIPCLVTLNINLAWVDWVLQPKFFTSISQTLTRGVVNLLVKLVQQTPPRGAAGFFSKLIEYMRRVETCVE